MGSERPSKRRRKKREGRKAGSHDLESNGAHLTTRIFAAHAIHDPILEDEGPRNAKIVDLTRDSWSISADSSIPNVQEFRNLIDDG